LSNLSVFPSGGVDVFQRHYDIQASDIPLIQQYQQLLMNPNRTPDQDTQLLNLKNQLIDKLIFADDMNKLQDAITNIETFFLNNVDGYVQTKQAEMDAEVNKFTYMGTYNPSTTYMRKNIVTYLGESYICQQDNTVGQTPDPTNANTTYWAKIAPKGDKGDKGDPGAVWVFRNAYSSTANYNINDAVQYNGALYVCIAPCTNIDPTNTTYWSLAVNCTPQNNSITNSMFTSDVQVGSLATLTTNDKSSVTNAINEVNGKVNNKIDSTQKGVANGIASLDSSGKVPSSQLPIANSNSVGAVQTTANPLSGNPFVPVRLASANDVQITSTSAQTVVSYTPTSKGNFLIYVYFRVVNSATNVTIQVTYNDGSGSQINTILPTSSQSVNSYSLLPLFINATNGSPINVNVTAGTANQVYVSSVIMGV
jgi:hypothetical protein